MQLTTEISPTQLKVVSSYNPAVISEFRSRGGKWDGSAWVFSNGSLKNGLAAVKELFGISDETVTIQVRKKDDGREYMTNAVAAERGLKLPHPDSGPDAAGCTQAGPAVNGWENDQYVPAVNGWENDQYVTVGGYVLASRRGRDSIADIVATLVSGKIPGAGGSVKNPNVNASDDCVFELEVRKDWAIANGFFTSDEREALRTERAALVARLAEIDAKLTA